MNLSFSAVAAFGLATFLGVVAWGVVQVLVFGRYAAGFPGAAQVAIQSHVLLGLFALVGGVILVHTGARLRPGLHAKVLARGRGTAIRAGYAGLLFAVVLQSSLAVWPRFGLEQTAWWVLFAAYPLGAGIYLVSGDRTLEP